MRSVMDRGERGRARDRRSARRAGGTWEGSRGCGRQFVQGGRPCRRRRGPRREAGCSNHGRPRVGHDDGRLVSAQAGRQRRLNIGSVQYGRQAESRRRTEGEAMNKKPAPSPAERMDDAEFERLRVWNIRYGEWSAPGEISLALDALIAEARRARASDAALRAALKKAEEENERLLKRFREECDCVRLEQQRDTAEARVAELEKALRELHGRTGLCHGAIMGFGCSGNYDGTVVHSPKCATVAALNAKP